MISLTLLNRPLETTIAICADGCYPFVVDLRVSKKSFAIALWAFGCITSLLVFERDAMAQDITVAVLGVQSMNGDDATAKGVTQALRREATRRSHWAIVELSQSLAQLSLIHGCDVDADRNCLHDIATAIGAEQLLFGKMYRNRDKQVVALQLFDARENKILRTARTTARADTIDVEAGIVAKKLLDELIVNRGSVRVESDRDGQVTIGSTTENIVGGTALVENIDAGVHEVVLTDGDEERRSSVTVTANEETTVSLSFGDSTEGGVAVWRWVVGGALVVGGGISLGIGINSALIVSNYRDQRSALVDNPSLANPTAFQRLLLDAGSESPGTDACSGNYYTADSKEGAARKDACDEIDINTTLQWVLSGLGVAMLGAGTYFLVDAILDLDDDDDDSRAFILTPAVGPNEAGLTLYSNF